MMMMMMMMAWMDGCACLVCTCIVDLSRGERQALSKCGIIICYIPHSKVERGAGFGWLWLDYNICYHYSRFHTLT